MDAEGRATQESKPKPLNFAVRPRAEVGSRQNSLNKQLIRAQTESVFYHSRLLVQLASDGVLVNINFLGGKGQLQAITNDNARIYIRLGPTVTKSEKIGNCSVH